MRTETDQDLRETMLAMREARRLQQLQIDALSQTMQYVLRAVVRTSNAAAQAVLADLNEHLLVMTKTLDPQETDKSARPVMLRQFRDAIHGARGS